MFSMTVQSTINREVQFLQGLVKNVPLATAKALTFTAERVREAEREEINKVFDRPTPYTRNSLFLKSATPQRLESRVWFKDYHGTQQHYLVPQVEGGQRPLKAFERHLIAAGWLKHGEYVVPGERAQLDAYGNMNRGQIVQILSALRALPQQGYLANRNARSEARRAKSKRPRALVNYFVGRPNPKSPVGVWERVPNSGGLRPIMIFVNKLQYRVRFKFYEIAQRVTDREFPIQLRKTLGRSAAI